MNYKIISLILTIFILAGCNQDIQNKNSIKFSSEQKYKNTGFTLVYNNDLKKEYFNVAFAAQKTVCCRKQRKRINGSWAQSTHQTHIAGTQTHPLY